MLGLTSCATLFDGGPDMINIMTSDGDTVPAQVVSKAGVQNVWLPTVVTVPKSCSDISISVREDNYVYPSNAIASSSLNPWTLGNFIFGWLLGFAIDGLSGNICTYDNNVVVPVYPK